MYISDDGGVIQGDMCITGKFPTVQSVKYKDGRVIRGHFYRFVPRATYTRIEKYGQLSNSYLGAYFFMGIKGDYSVEAAIQWCEECGYNFTVS